MSEELPEGYYIIDSDDRPHDGDEDDGRYGLYVGDPDDAEAEFEFLGNLHDRAEVVALAWEHAGGIVTPDDDFE